MERKGSRLPSVAQLLRSVKGGRPPGWSDYKLRKHVKDPVRLEFPALT
jgi:hypothetical protein